MNYIPPFGIANACAQLGTSIAQDYRTALSQQQQQAILSRLQSLYGPYYSQSSKPKAFPDTPFTTPKETKVSDSNNAIPDISLGRVFKWSIVLIVAMFLGKRVWDMFGEKLTKQVHKALDSASAS